MAANGTDLHQVVNQLKQQVSALEKQHSRSVSQAIRPIQGELERLKVELGRAQRKFNALEDDFKSFRAAERERRRQHDALKAGVQDARSATVAAEGDIAAIDTILATALPPRPPAFDELRDPGAVPHFVPGRLGVAEPAPRWEDYDPGPARLLSRAIGLTGGHERRLDDAKASYQADCDAHRDRELRRELELNDKQDHHRRGAAAIRARAAAQNAEVETMRTAFAAGDPEAVSWFVRKTLERSEYPAWYRDQARQHRVAARPDRGDIIVELELPPAAAIPVVRRYEYDEHLAARRKVPRSHAEIGAQYASLIASVALRTASEVLAATAERADTVRTVTINGRATGNDAAIGQDCRPHLISVSVTREALDGLFLARVQPLSCLAAMGARISLDPLSGAAVEPIEDFPVLLTNINVDRPSRPI
jgi:restriction system protein